MTLLLLNLVDNAVKYGGSGPISVRLEKSARGHELTLQIIDRGLGIAPDEQRKIFERFYRTRAVRNTSIRGSGIGLALVKHIAESHGGRATVVSVPGEGSMFTVTLPVRTPEPDPDSEPEPPDFPRPAPAIEPGAHAAPPPETPGKGS
jgi:two-component system, OmpR family, sensor histidine kinase SenX3